MQACWSTGLITAVLDPGFVCGLGHLGQVLCWVPSIVNAPPRHADWECSCFHTDGVLADTGSRASAAASPASAFGLLGSIWPLPTSGISRASGHSSSPHFLCVHCPPFGWASGTLQKRKIWRGEFVDVFSLLHVEPVPIPRVGNSIKDQEVVKRWKIDFKKSLIGYMVTPYT